MQRKVAVSLFVLVSWLAPAQVRAAPVVLHDADVICDSTLVRGATASIHVATFGATDLVTRHPLPGARVTVWLQPATKQGARQEIAAGVTSHDGSLTLGFMVPRDLATGDYKLVVHTRSRHGQHTVTQMVSVVDSSKLHLRTDRGMYAPGQIVRWRVTAVNATNAHPLGDQKLQIAIEDPRGTAIWRGTRTTDQTGMIAGEVPLGKELVLGVYSLVVRSAHIKSSKVEARTTFQVRAYRLPAFTVAIEPASKGPHAPGSTLKGRVVARYLHGEPVSGAVQVRAHARGAARTLLDTNLDKHGRAPFVFAIPKDARAASLVATVRDSAGRSQAQSFDISLPPDRMEIEIIPERRSLIRDTQQWVTILTTDGEGGFVETDLHIDVGTNPDGKQGTTIEQVHSRGAVRVPITPGRQATMLRVRATSRSGHVATAELDCTGRAGRRHWIRLRKVVVAGGEAIEIAGTWRNAHGPVVATLMRKGAPLATAVARVDAQGQLSARLVAPPGVFGLATVRVTDARWDETSGSIEPLMDWVSVFIRPTRLDVSIAGATRKKPGDTARLDVAVRDAAGNPVAGAGLAASVVDERALLLAEPGPDLVAALRALDKGEGEAAGLVFARLLEAGESAESRVAMRALVEALPPERARASVYITAADRLRSEHRRMGHVREAMLEGLTRDVRPLGKSGPEAMDFARPLDQVLARRGWTRNKRLTPWRKPMDWAYARTLAPDLFAFDEVVDTVAYRKLHGLAARLYDLRGSLSGPAALGRLVKQGKVARYLVVDPWGTAVRLEPTRAEQIDRADHKETRGKHWSVRSAGKDRRFDSDDDIVFEDVTHTMWGEALFGTAFGVGSGHAGFAARGAAVAGVRMGAASFSPEVAVRKRFDQTVLWVAGVPTNETGQAMLQVPLADSITGWRVDVQALGPRGGVGTARARLETALPMYLDVDMPGDLTVGDRYELPVIVANHSSKQAALEVHARLGGSVEFTGKGTIKQLVLPAGTTTMVPVHMRARSVGTGTVEVRLRHARGADIDAVKHTVEVKAPGRRVQMIPRAEIADSEARFSFTVPADRADGTVAGILRLYRGVVDQAMDGLEGMLQEPHGCFEQTSSTTYPNLLVLGLLDNTAENAGVRARARDLVAKGYQRLVSYEVEGGGFSWFGDSPANQVLSAYGLMEFADMARVYPVDPALIARTQTWLLDQQNADGSWNKDKHWLHDWSAVQGRVQTTAYLAWALSESGYRGKKLDRAFAYLAGHRDEMAKNPYLLALWAAAESARGRRTSTALSLLRKHGHAETGALRFGAGSTTLFYAKGQSADAQVTALAALALERAGRRGDARDALAWLWTARSPNYGWGTTQGTVLALRAAQAITTTQPVKGAVTVRLDGQALGTIDLDGDTDGGGVPSLRLPRGLLPGRHEVVLAGVGESLEKGAVRADLRVAWQTSGTPRAVSQGMVVSLSSSRLPVRVGQRYDMTLLVQNPGTDAIAMPTAVIPVPPGFRADAGSLRALERSGRVTRAEDMGSEIHLYMDKLEARGSLVLPYRLEALAACNVAQASARAYAYYDPDTWGASAALRLSATPRK